MAALEIMALMRRDYVEISVEGLDVVLGREGVYVIPNQESLDLAGRIVSWGKVGEIIYDEIHMHFGFNRFFYLELNIENIALREIILHKDTHSFEVSCISDCFAEGEIDLSQIEGNICELTEEQFEAQWKIYTSQQRDNWNKIKQSAPIGQHLQMQQCYVYPQGIVLKQQDLIAVCEKSDCFSLNQNTIVRITGYDDVNMWLIVESVNPI